MFEQFLHALKNETFISLETTPAHSATCGEIVENIKNMGLDTLVNGFTTTDSPLSKLKFNSLLAAIRIQQEFHKPAIATMSMRDRNIIALQSDLLGANEFDIRTILALTGDSVKISDQPGPKAVLEGDSTLLLKIISHLNRGIDLAGKKLKVAPKRIYPLAVAPSDISKEKSLCKKMTKKLQGGAIAIITQPIFNPSDIKPLRAIFEAAKKEARTPDAVLVIGFFPIVKYKTANFLNTKVPGANIPAHWLDALQNSDNEYQTGFALSKEVFEAILNDHGKTHLMAANNFALARDMLQHQ
ncbi:MAG: methylenetetrahydrofolate reductase [Campylobacterota bacterium]